MAVTLNKISVHQTTGTKALTKSITHVLNLCATHPKVTLEYKSSNLIIYIHSNASYLIVAEGKIAQAVFLLMFPTARPHQTTHSTPNPQRTALRIMLNHAQRIGISHGSRTGRYFYQSPKRSTNPNCINRNGPPPTGQSHLRQHFFCRNHQEQYHQTTPLRCHRHSFLLDHRLR